MPTRTPLVRVVNRIRPDDHDERMLRAITGHETTVTVNGEPWPIIRWQASNAVDGVQEVTLTFLARLIVVEEVGS